MVNFSSLEGTTQESRDFSHEMFNQSYMDIYMKEPKDFPSFLYMSQVLQAEAMKMAIEAHRRRKPYCMGSLYWQMNDCWPAASWAGMDYYGRWKAMQYYAKRSFRDVMLSIDGTSGERVDFHVVSDQVVPAEGVLHISLIDFSGNALGQVSTSVCVAANTADRVYSAAVEDLLTGVQVDRSELVLNAQLMIEGRVVDSKEHYFVPVKHIKLAAPQLKLTSAIHDGAALYTIETDVLAKQMWLSTEAEGYFSDNFFDVIPGQPVSVTFRSSRNESDLPGAVQIRSMFDFVK